jgi:rod shape-determining protein MreC
VSSELSSNVRKERAVLVTISLLLLQLILLSLQIESPSGTLLFKKWALAAQSPVVTVFSSVTGGIRHVWRSYFWMVGARAENEHLKQTIGELSQLKSNYEQIQLENARLRRLTSLSSNTTLRTIGARVVARTPMFLSNVIYIDRGSKDGLRNDMPVLYGDKIVGRTVLVTGHLSQVQLITNPDASVGAMLERTRTPGVLRGSGKLLLDLNYISNAEQIGNGDIVLSSGLDGVFPKGLVIGKVVDSRKGKDIFRSVKVELSVDLIHLEEVSVLLSESKPEMGIVQQP